MVDLVAHPGLMAFGGGSDCGSHRRHRPAAQMEAGSVYAGGGVHRSGRRGAGGAVLEDHCDRFPPAGQGGQYRRSHGPLPAEATAGG
jgi:hypothetical protein